MSQDKHTPVKWIVPIPKDDPFGRISFTAACHGNPDIGEVLNYFTYEASREVEYEHLDISQLDHIVLHRTLDKILKRVKVSAKTLIAYIDKLEEWKLIVAHGYRHLYDVYFKNIAEAITNPPEQEKKKPRGRNAKSTIRTISTNSQEDCKDLPDCRIGEIVLLRSQIVNLQSEIVVLQSQIVNLQSLQSSKGNVEAASDSIFGSPNSNKEISIDSEREYVGSSEPANAPTSLSSHSTVIVDEQNVPVTYAECLAYLQQRSIPTEALDAIQVMTAARSLYVKQYPSAPASLSEFAERKHRKETDPVLSAVVKTGTDDTESQYHIANLDTVTMGIPTVATASLAEPDVTTPLDGDVAPVDYMTDDDPERTIYRMPVVNLSQQGAPSHDDTPLSVAGGLPADRATPAVVPGDGLPGCDGIQRPLQAESRTEVSAQEIAFEQTPDLQANPVSRPPVPPVLALPPGSEAHPVARDSLPDNHPQAATLPALFPPAGQPVASVPVGAAPRTASPPDGSPVSSGTVQASGAIEQQALLNGDALIAIDTTEAWEAARTAYVEQIKGAWKKLGRAEQAKVGPWATYQKRNLDAWQHLHPKPKDAPLEEACRTIYHKLTHDWRGYALEGNAVINEYTYIRKFVLKYRTGEIDGVACFERVYVHMTTKDFKWSKPSFRFKVGAYEVYQEAPSVLKQLEEKPPVQNGKPAQEEKIGNYYYYQPEPRRRQVQG